MTRAEQRLTAFLLSSDDLFCLDCLALALELPGAAVRAAVTSARDTIVESEPGLECAACRRTDGPTFTAV